MATYQVHDVFGYKELHDVEALFYCSTENLLSCCLSSVFLWSLNVQNLLRFSWYMPEEIPKVLEISGEHSLIDNFFSYHV
jgi:hypothetical protein